LNGNSATPRTYFCSTSSQLARLHDEGVPDSVIDYVQQTYLHAVRWNQALEDWNHWALAADGFWYGGLPYGWPPEWWVFKGQRIEESERHHERTGEGEWHTSGELTAESHRGAH
jgi:hypothetical protein